MDYITYIKSLIARYWPTATTDINKLVKTFDKLLLDAETFTQKGIKELELVQKQIDQLQALRDQKNLDVDRAFRIVHKVGELVK